MGHPRAMLLRIDSSSPNVQRRIDEIEPRLRDAAPGPTLNQLGRSAAALAHIAALDHRQFFRLPHQFRPHGISFRVTQDRQQMFV